MVVGNKMMKNCRHIMYWFLACFLMGTGIVYGQKISKPNILGSVASKEVKL